MSSGPPSGLAAAFMQQQRAIMISKEMIPSLSVLIDKVDAVLDDYLEDNLRFRDYDDYMRANPQGTSTYNMLQVMEREADFYKLENSAHDIMEWLVKPVAQFALRSEFCLKASPLEYNANAFSEQLQVSAIQLYGCHKTITQTLAAICDFHEAFYSDRTDHIFGHGFESFDDNEPFMRRLAERDALYDRLGDACRSAQSVLVSMRHQTRGMKENLERLCAMPVPQAIGNAHAEGGLDFQ